MVIVNRTEKLTALHELNIKSEFGNQIKPDCKSNLNTQKKFQNFNLNY
jgi:hypothetical protein